MRLELVPLLASAREMYELPRGMERFRSYVVKAGADETSLMPLLAMNPLGREPVARTLDRLLDFDAEGVAAQTLRDAQAELPAGATRLKVGLAVADDSGGCWTHRELTEAAFFFETSPSLARGWIVVPLWTSDEPDERHVRAETRAAVRRAAHQIEHGQPTSLREMMWQEGEACRFAGRHPSLDATHLDAARAVLGPMLDERAFGACFAAMYGDRAAQLAGHAGLGLPERAGFEVAMADAGEPRA